MREKNIFFSVVVPLYNKENYIAKSIESVLKQTYNNFEIIVINDGSTDNGPELVEKIIDKKVRLISQVNKGESSARNLGIKNSNGDFICFLDADDLYLENHLSTLSALINHHPHESFYATNYYNKFKNAPENKIAISRYKQDTVIKNYFLEARGMPLVTSNTACIHKSVFDKVGYFDTSLKFGPDLEFWFRIALSYPLVFSPIPTTIYQRDADNRVMHDYSEFNTALIDKLILNAKHRKLIHIALPYIEFIILREIKNLLLKGNNRSCIIKIWQYRNYQTIRSKVKFLIFSLLPIKLFIRMKSIYNL